MREIKFKAFHKETGIMSEAFTLLDALLRNLIETIEWKNGILLQFTGLKDKNGVEIYEGDIVTCQGGYDTPEGNTPECECARVVVWEQEVMQFMAHCENCRESTPLYEYDLENVIGNIYQNPSLLKA